MFQTNTKYIIIGQIVSKKLSEFVLLYFIDRNLILQVRNS